MEEQYFQCTLTKGEETTIGWIEERGAFVGAIVELLDLDGEFWTVTIVGDKSLPKSLIRENERKFKAFQKSTRGGGIDN